jgi:ribonuclease BN (tRNA processing enzyme)
LVDHDILIDAGTGVGELSIAELTQIDHVFLTHCHLDHIATLPMMIDTVADCRSKPITLYGTEAVLDSLRKHIFNWAIWPDFSAVPSTEQAFMRYQTVEIGKPVILDGRRITALPVDHTVPAVGYSLDSGLATLVFSGDTGPCEAFWQALNSIPKLRHLIVECAFPNREQRLAELEALLARHAGSRAEKVAAPVRDPHHTSEAWANRRDHGRNQPLSCRLHPEHA